MQVGEVNTIYLENDWLEHQTDLYVLQQVVVTRIRPFSQDHLRSPVNTQDCGMPFPSPKKRARAITSKSPKISKQNASAEDFEEGTLEYKAIPWSSNASDNSLTINYGTGKS